MTAPQLDINKPSYMFKIISVLLISLIDQFGYWNGANGGWESGYQKGTPIVPITPPTSPSSW